LARDCQYLREIRQYAYLREVNELLTYSVMVDSLIVAYIHCIIMLIEFKESAKCSDYIKCQQSEKASVCVTRLPQSYWNGP